MIRILHTGDWHLDADPAKQAKIKAALDQMLIYCKSNDVDAIVHSGDIWEKKQSYADRSGVPLAMGYLRELSKYVGEIFIVKGNNSHDEPGSVALLHQLEPNIYAYEQPAVLAKTRQRKIINLLTSETYYFNPLYIVSLVPYPTKSMFITNDSIDNNNEEFIAKFENVFDVIGSFTEVFDCPKVLDFHGNVVGSRLSSGQNLLTQDIMVSPSTLYKAKADYYALGHIHLEQSVTDIMKYSGSIYNKNWGETEQKSFTIVEFNEGKEPKIYSVPLESARPMIKQDVVFNGTSFLIDEQLKADNAEYRVRVTVAENDKALLTPAQIDMLKTTYGHDAKIEIITIPSQRESRSEKIMNCKTLYDEVKEYAAVIEADLNQNIEKKVSDLQEVTL